MADDDRTVEHNPAGETGAEPRFRLIKPLGSGGMGDVHLAEDRQLMRKVAIKSIRREVCENPGVRKRIERECLLHAKIGSHPNIVTLFDRLEDGGEIKLVMEYVEGDTLHAMLDTLAKEGKRLPWRDGLALAAQTLDALTRIHAQGIVHRDIKPSNILVTRDDEGELQAKLMDFGIARPSSEEEMTALTQEGGGPGTPLYMAPEQIDPRTFGEIGPATDVYAMGVMLYQLVSGRAPYSGSITEIFNGHLNQTAPPPDVSGDPSVPPALTEVIECAMSKRPEQRFSSAKAFRDELLRLKLNAPAETQGATAAAAGLDPNRTVVDTGAGAPHATRVATGDAQPAGTLLATGPAQAGGKRGMLIAVAALAVVVIAVGALGAAMVFLSGDEAPDTAQPAAVTTPGAADEPAETAVEDTTPAPPVPTRTAPAALPSATAPPEPDGPVSQPDDGPSVMDAFMKAREANRANNPPPEPVADPDPPAPTAAQAPPPEPDGPVTQPQPQPQPEPQPEPRPDPQPRRQPEPEPDPEPEPEPDDDDPFAGFKVERRTEKKVD